MIVLKNYLKSGSYIIISSSGFYETDEINISFDKYGLGIIDDDGNAFGIYVYNKHLYMYYKKEIINIDNCICSNEYIQGYKRNFVLKIYDRVVVNYIYNPYVSTLSLMFGGEEDEFDFWLYLYGLLKSEKTKYDLTEALSGILIDMNNRKLQY